MMSNANFKLHAKKTRKYEYVFSANDNNLEYDRLFNSLRNDLLLNETAFTFLNSM